MLNSALVRQIEKKHAMSLTEKDILFLSLYDKHNMDTKKAYKEFSKTYSFPLHLLIQKLKHIILDIVEANLIMASGDASSTLVDIMTQKKMMQQASVKLEAAKTVLDRVGLGKKETINIDVGKGGGLFIIPAKVPIAIEAAPEEKTIEGEAEVVV